MNKIVPQWSLPRFKTWIRTHFLSPHRTQKQTVLKKKNCAEKSKDFFFLEKITQKKVPKRLDFTIILSTKKFPPPTAISKNFLNMLYMPKGTPKHSSTYFKTIIALWHLKIFLWQKVVWKIAKKRCFWQKITPPCRNTQILAGSA